MKIEKGLKKKRIVLNILKVTHKYHSFNSLIEFNYPPFHLLNQKRL